MRLRCLSLLVLFLIAGVGLFAQTSSLSGTVVDPSGALIPGADVVVKNNATGATFRTVTEGDGEFVQDFFAGSGFHYERGSDLRGVSFARALSSRYCGDDIPRDHHQP